MCTLLKYSEVVCKTAEVDTVGGHGIDNINLNSRLLNFTFQKDMLGVEKVPQEDVESGPLELSNKDSLGDDHKNESMETMSISSIAETTRGKLQRSLPSEFQIAPIAVAPSATSFLLHVSCVVLFLFSAACCIIATAEVNSEKGCEGFEKYRMTFVVLMFLSKVLVGKLIKRTFEMNSPLYQSMQRHVQEKAVGALEVFVQAFYWVPIITHFAYITYATIHQPRVAVFQKFGPYIANILFAGLLDQIYELMVRHPDVYLYAHHFYVIGTTILLLEGLPLDQKCGGVLLLGIQSGLDRLTYCVIVTSYFQKQRSLQLDLIASSLGQPFVLEGADVLLPEIDTLQRCYRVAFYHYAVVVRAMVSSAVLIYFIFKWNDTVLVWKILLPLAVAFFYLVDFPTYQLLWRRSV
jgi:hypothetical protein